MNCIRCGAEVTFQGRMFVTLGGDYVCPASLQGEAAVHRVASQPVVLTKQPRGGTGPLGIALSFLAGRAVGNLIFNHHQAAPVLQQPPPPFPGTGQGSQNLFT